MSILIKVPEAASRRIGFTYSPALEAILSVSILLQPDHHPLHHEWVRETRKLLPTQTKQGLADFRFSHFSFIPAGLIPPTPQAPPDFDSELARIRSHPVEDISMPILRNLTRASDAEWAALDDPEVRGAILERTADFGSQTVEMVRLGIERPSELAETFLQFVSWYWELSFHREWDQRIEPGLAATVAEAGSGPGSSGLYPMLETLRPRIGVDRRAGELHIRRAHEEEIELAEDAEIVFVPSAFLWPHIGVACETPDRLALLYPAPFASYDSPPELPGSDLLPLLRALGDATRLQALKLIAERPRSTQELASLIGISRSATSGHLRKLAECGALETERDGYYQLYSLDRERIESLPSMLRDFLDSG